MPAFPGCLPTTYHREDEEEGHGDHEAIVDVVFDHIDEHRDVPLVLLAAGNVHGVGVIRRNRVVENLDAEPAPAASRAAAATPHGVLIAEFVGRVAALGLHGGRCYLCRCWPAAPEPRRLLQALPLLEGKIYSR